MKIGKAETLIEREDGEQILAKVFSSIAESKVGCMFSAQKKGPLIAAFGVGYFAHVFLNVYKRTERFNSVDRRSLEAEKRRKELNATRERCDWVLSQHYESLHTGKI